MPSGAPSVPALVLNQRGIMAAAVPKEYPSPFLVAGAAFPPSFRANDATPMPWRGGCNLGLYASQLRAMLFRLGCCQSQPESVSISTSMRRCSLPSI